MPHMHPTDYLVALVTVVAILARPAWVLLVSPRGDVSRIRQDYEGRGRKILSIRRCGTQATRSIYGGAVYRKYEVVFEEPTASVPVRRIVGVRDGPFADAGLKIFQDQPRTEFEPDEGP